ncbi:MAG: hypothetical protein H6589_06130 [Flavobacteriales bacterium]|nr:hypothetical protein [Flavobacteriales bacterium]
MKPLKDLCFKSTLLIVCLIFSSFSPKFNSTNQFALSVFDALERNMVNCVITSKGGHQGNCIDMLVENKSPNRLVLKLESGRNLVSLDSNSQDILVVKEELFVLNPSQKQQKEVFGFCSQSHKSSPSSGEGYIVGEMKDKNIVALTQHLAVNKYPISAMQQAIWTMTNNRDIASIFHENRDSIERLQDFVAQFTKTMSPWYSIEYVQPDSGLVSDVAKSIHGNIEKRLPKNVVVKIVVFDKFNIAQIRTETITREQDNKHPFSVNVQSLPKGRYHIGFFTLGGRLDEKVFSI